ncbi:MAG: MarR family transcriptional regulator [Chloroflexi bacterium]|nr:MarR family transcriptional regulator [Chloroflexota bacterium]MCC6893469.1 MarR family transcriptional regulator [Anaerolineae bacterium]
MCHDDRDRHSESSLAERFMRVFEMSHHQMSQEKQQHHHHAFKDLSINKLVALNMLYRQPGSAQKELAEFLQITPAAVSTAVRELENTGLVERKPDQDDVRLMRLYLSEKAHQIVGETIKHRHDAIAKLLDVLPSEEQHMIVTSLEKALQILTTRDVPLSLQSDNEANR